MKHNFLFTILTSLLAAIGLVAYIILKIPPNPWLQWVLVLVIGYIFNAIFAIVFYIFAKPRGHESEKMVFRRQFKKGAIIGLIVVTLLSTQILLDVL